MGAIRLGDLLIKANLITERQLSAALLEQQRWGGKLGDLLVRMNFITEETLLKALGKQFNTTATNLDLIQGIPVDVRRKVPEDIARQVFAVPLQLRDQGKTLVVAMADPQNLTHQDSLRAVSGCRIAAQLAGRQAIGRAIERFYHSVEEKADQPEQFQLLDALGQSVNKVSTPLTPSPSVPRGPNPQLSAPRPPPPFQAKQSSVGVPARELLKSLEETQKKEVAVLKGLVELLISKGIFTRDEYLAKLKAPK